MSLLGTPYLITAKEYSELLSKYKYSEAICRNCGEIMSTDYERDTEKGNDLYYIYYCKCGREQSELQG